MRHPLFSTVLAISLSTATTPVLAQHQHIHRPMPMYKPHPHSPGWGWVAPAIIGGAVVYGLTRPAPVVIQQPVYIQQPMPMDVPQVVMIDGVAYTRQVMIVNGVSQEVLVRQ